MYSLSTFEPMQNLHLGVSKALKSVLHAMQATKPHDLKRAGVLLLAGVFCV